MRTALVVLLLAGQASAAEPGAPELRGTYVWRPRAPDAPPALAGPHHRTLFVNRWGGTYYPGDDDSSLNRTSIASQTSAMPAYSGSDDDWQVIMDCLREIYGPFAIDVVDVEPTAGTYIESVVGGRYTDLIGAPPSGGVSPFACETIERSINFTFAADFGDDTRLICEVVAQESGHSFGMDHEYLCSDPMTYLPACGNRHFQDVYEDCGEFERRPCRCVAGKQNTHQWLLDVLGPRDDQPPAVAVTEPLAGDTVTAGFPVTAEGNDDVRLDRIEFFIDGVLFEADDRPPYDAFAPLDLGAGPHVLRAEAVDGDENRTGEDVPLDVAPGCAVDADCGDGRVCAVDHCLGDVGTDCDVSSDCASGVCYADLVSQFTYCTIGCGDGLGDCPSGFECKAPQFGPDRCMPKHEGGGCGVGTGEGSAGWGGLLLVLLGYLAFVARRRSAQ